MAPWVTVWVWHSAAGGEMPVVGPCGGGLSCRMTVRVMVIRHTPLSMEAAPISA